MDHYQIDGIDAYGFPGDLRGHPLLSWMGEDYVRHLALELVARFRQQDSGTSMLSIQCDRAPSLQSTVDERTGTVQGVDLSVGLTIVLRDSNGGSWKLSGDATSRATGLGTGILSTTIGFDIRSTEPVRAQPKGENPEALLERYGRALTDESPGATELRNQLVAVTSQAGHDAANQVLRGLAYRVANEPLQRAAHAAVATGALVEGGADPGIAVGPILERLVEVLPVVGRLEREIESRTGGGELTPEIREALARDFPNAEQVAEAFNLLQMAAIAHLSRSRKARDLARGHSTLRHLVSENASNYFIAGMVNVLDDEELLVLVPAHSKAFAVRISGVVDNFQLQVLLADLLIGSKELPGFRPTASVTAIADGSGPQESREMVQSWWDMYAPTALLRDLSLPRDVTEVPAEQVIWNEGSPSDIPSVGGRRTLLLAPTSFPRNWLASRPFGGLKASITLVRVVPAEEVQQLLKMMALHS
jgi:hypothetical protein